MTVHLFIIPILYDVRTDLDLFFPQVMRNRTEKNENIRKENKFFHVFISFVRNSLLKEGGLIWFK